VPVPEQRNANMPTMENPAPFWRTRRLALSASILYLVIPAMGLALLLLIGNIISNSIANDFARRLARQYSIEAAANFQVSTNSHFVLMRQISRSTTIARWLANEADLESKAIAFDEIMGFAVYVPDLYLMFTVYETLQGYDFETDLVLEEFVPWGRLYGGAVSQWFFNTRDAEMPFILNVQRTRPDEYGRWDLYIWSNSRMYYQGRFVGVVTVGTPFDAVFDAVFGSFDVNIKRGYIIDNNGAVRADSARLLTVHEHGLPILPALPEAIDEPNLYYGIKSHLQNLSAGIFQPSLEQHDAIALSAGIYRYGSITPIIGTDWSVVVLSTHEGIFVGRYVPMITSAIVLLVLSVLIGNIVVRRAVLVPLFKLTRSAAAAANVSTKEKLFGIERKDELGDLARTIQFMRENIKAAQEMEREAFALTQFIFDAAPYVIGLWDENGNIVKASKYAATMFEIADSQMIVDGLFVISPEFQPCGTPTPIKAAEQIGRTYKEDFVRFEWMHKTSDGSPLPAECVFKRFRHKGKDMLVSYTMDLRKFKAAEKKERDANEMVNILLDASPVFIEIWDERFNLTDCNNQFMNLYGLASKAEFFEKHEELSPEYQPCGTSSKEKRAALLEQALREGHARSEWLNLTVDGEELPVEAIYVRIMRQDKYFIVEYNHDLRQIKKAMAEVKRIEVAEESSKAKSKFLARMSHEIRTPIAAVLGISEIQLQNPELPPLIEESFAKIHNSSNMLLSIVNDILDLSKIEAGKMTLLCDEYEVASMISDVAHVHLTNFGTKNIEFHMQVDENLPAFLIGDALRIGQVTNNLLSNAFKYTNSGSVELSLRHEKDEANEAYVMLIVSIRDTGMGMTREQLDVLYNEYERFHEREHRFISGTGLGMPIVYNLVKIMDGDIALESEVGKGTNVTVRIPQKLTSDTKVLGKEGSRNLQQFGVSASAAVKKFKFVPEPMPYGKVLIVDDVEANLYVAQGLLAFHSLHIETCESGYEAIDKVKQGKVYDIVFMDHMMPGLNGTETMHAMREMGYTQPIVALTANALIGQAEEFIKNGFDGFISKPIQTKQLNNILNKHIRDKQPPEVLEAARAARDRHMSAATGDIDNYLNQAGVVEKLRWEFVRSQKNVFGNISQALNAGDLKTAHRLAHSLKGLAALINENALAKAAGNVEQLLAAGEMPTNHLDALESELARVIGSIDVPNTPLFPIHRSFDKAKATVLFDKLYSMLASDSVECFSLLDELRAIPETGVLVRQIEEYDFADALQTMGTLREILEV